MNKVMILKKIWLWLVLLACAIIVIISGITEKSEMVVNSKIYDNARSTIVMDVGTGRILYEKNAYEKLLPASITKILTCIVAIENYDLDRLVVVTDEMIKTNGSSIYLASGDVISIRDLLYGLMLCSGNDAAKVLSFVLSGEESDFIDLMNKTAKKIGMKNSYFNNPSGLDEETKNYTTAYDMALLTSYASKNEEFKKIASTKEYYPTIASGKKMYFVNKHRLVRNNVALLGKTGYTKSAHRTLVSLFEQDGFEIVVVTFKCSDDWTLHQNLKEYIFNKYKMVQVISLFDLYLTTSINEQVDVSELLLPVLKNEVIDYEIIETDEAIFINYYLENELIAKKCVFME